MMLKKIPLFFCFTLLFHWSIGQHIVNFHIPDCPVVHLKENSSRPEAIPVFPNPADDFFYMTLPCDHESFSIEVVSIHGQTVLIKTTSGQIANPIQIRTNHWPAGIYIIHVKSNAAFYHKRLIVL